MTIEFNKDELLELIDALEYQIEWMQDRHKDYQESIKINTDVITRLRKALAENG